MMDANRDEAEKCLVLCRECLRLNDISRARWFAEKSRKLYWTAEAENIIQLNTSSDSSSCASQLPHFPHNAEYPQPRLERRRQRRCDWQAFFFTHWNTIVATCRNAVVRRGGHPIVKFLDWIGIVPKHRCAAIVLFVSLILSLTYRFIIKGPPLGFVFTRLLDLSTLQYHSKHTSVYISIWPFVVPVVAMAAAKLFGTTT
jgi:hypothetical protein